MSDPQLWLDPQRAYRAGQDLTHAGKAIGAQRTGLGAEIAAASAGQPWGSDDIGAAFEKGYRPAEQVLMQAWEKIGAYVEGLGAAVCKSVSDSVATDAESGTRITKSYRPTGS